MARARQQASVVLERATAQSLYPPPRVVSKQVPLTDDAIDALPGDVRRAVRAAVRPGSVVVLVVDENDAVLRILVRNR